jgi:hypothetical protein
MVKFIMQLPSFLRKYFWDSDFVNLDINNNDLYIITRLLEHGDLKATKWLLKNIDIEKIKKVILKSRELSPKTGNFWMIILNLNKTKVQCLKKSYQKMLNSHWRY